MDAVDFHKMNFLIIGAGKVGISIAEYLKSAGMNLRIYTRNFWDNPFLRFSGILSDKDCINDVKIDSYYPDIIFITVADKYIQDFSDIVVNKYSDNLEGKIVIHCSGIMTSELLNSCRVNGALTASLHPYQTFYKPKADLLNGIGWGIETDFDISLFIELIKFFGGSYHILKSKEEKVKYHLSAVVASNFFNSLLSAVIDLHKGLNIDFEKFAVPIINQTLDNACENYKDNSGKMPLTGPIARADINTIIKHLESINDNKGITLIYKLFAKATLETAKSQGIITIDDYNEFIRLLK